MVRTALPLTTNAAVAAAMFSGEPFAVVNA
jgi:hypothetical protein